MYAVSVLCRNFKVMQSVACEDSLNQYSCSLRTRRDTESNTFIFLPQHEIYKPACVPSLTYKAMKRCRRTEQKLCCTNLVQQILQQYSQLKTRTLGKVPKITFQLQTALSLTKKFARKIQSFEILSLFLVLLPELPNHYSGWRVLNYCLHVVGLF